MKLYEVPRNTWIRLMETSLTPPDCFGEAKGDVFLFKHIDGMYSLCTDKDGHYIHLVAWAEVEIVGKPVEK